MINLKADAGIQVFLRLVASADIVVESFRPGVMAKLGIDYERSHSINPRLVYCSLSGYGQTGPYRSRAGHDLNYSGLAGLLPIGSVPSGTEKSPEQLPAQIPDIGAAYAAAFAIVAAFVAQQRTSKGAYLDISLAEVSLTFGLLQLIGLDYTVAGIPHSTSAGNQLTGDYACYNIYKTADGKYMTLAVLEPSFWRSFLSVIGRLDLLEKHLHPSRQRELKATLAEIISQRTQQEWVTLFEEEPNACCEPVLKGSDILHHPQFQNRAIFFAGANGSQSVLQVATPTGQHPPHRPPAPGYGEHTAELLAGCGFSQDEIREFHRNGIIRLSTDK